MAKLRFPSISTWPTKTRDLRKTGKSRRLKMSTLGVSRKARSGRRTY